MNPFTHDELRRICPETPAERLALFVVPLNDACQEFGIDTDWDCAAFVAQLAHETGGFRWLKEIWGPTEQQKKYERDFEAAWPPTPFDTKNRVAFSLGNSIVGDGRLWLGRGGIQTTGRMNSVRVLAALNLPLNHPEELEQPENAMRSSGYFWKAHGMSAKANDKRFTVISAGVNGMFREFRPGDLDRYGFYEASCAARGLTHAEDVG